MHESFVGENKNRRKWIIIGIVGGIVALAIIIGLSVGLTRKSSGPSDAFERAKWILENNILIDGHNDLAWRILAKAKSKLNNVNLNDDLKKVWGNISHTDISRLKEGLLGGQFWALYVGCKQQYRDAVRAALEQADIIRRFIAKYPNVFEYATTADQVEEAFTKGKIASLIGMEGGHMIDSSLAALRMFYELGVRYLTLTHNCATPWATENGNENSFGLTDFGKRLIKEMNRMGMILDLSHVSVNTMKDALDTTKAPVMYSHSSARAKCDSFRNVPDDILRRVKDNGGVVMVNFYNRFISCNSKANLTQVADHIDHIKQTAGIDTVGIGGDYDGVDLTPIGLEDVSTYPKLFAELIRRNWSDEDLIKLAGKNILRVMRGVEKIKESMANDPVIEDQVEEKDLNMTCRTGFEEAIS
ncbi:unnamed protein product [Dimorphilus gyrociliatus]|uniref:Dipeptidase n=1 Tax=Dimorphilus gyrociliatus TaxID=2664684 RepID=A0A7I8W8C2_9ANNE|nr:unnamed protein product [Dimorphilus gyrociliatus]